MSECRYARDPEKYGPCAGPSNGRDCWQHASSHYPAPEPAAPECECSEEYGPCEEHGTVLAQREGASTRTADELLAVFCDDAWGILGEKELSPWGQQTLDAAWEMLESNRRYGVAWLPDTNDGDAMRDDLSTLAGQLESSLATMDEPAYTFWDDGYVIVRVSADSPLAGE